MTDHDLMFCTTLTLKYSFTSQNPASLTCEKNSDPQPMASTSSEVCVVLRSAASGARTPEAVTVATVADPVASRMSTATNQASRSTDTELFLTASAITVPMPVSMSVCL